MHPTWRGLFVFQRFLRFRTSNGPWDRCIWVSGSLTDVMTVTPPSPNRANMFSVCFPKAVSDYDILMDTVIDAN